jgi:hypothetical protein
MGSERADRFTWERAVRDPKVGMPRELLCLALLLATYSTGRTGDGIGVREATLRDVLGYDHERSVRRLIAELRDGYGVIRRTRHGNQYRPAGYALVIPGDLAERSEAARDSRAEDRKRASRQPKTRRAPDAVRPEQSGRAPDAVRPEQMNEHRTHSDRAPDAQRPSTGRSASPYYQENQVDQVPPSAGAAPLAPTAPTTQTILASFIDWDRSNGGQLTRRTIGQLAKYISGMLAEGVEEKHIGRGLAAWRAKRCNPSALHSFVDAAMAAPVPPAPSGRQAERNAMFDRAMARAKARDAARARGELP